MRERAKFLSRREWQDGDQMLRIIRDAPLVVELPERVVLWTAVMRRLAAQGGPSAGTRRDALPREYASPSGPYAVWLNVSARASEQAVREALPWLRSLGTRESLCRAEPVEPGRLPELRLAAGEASEDAGELAEGMLLEVRDVRPDVTLADLAKPDCYRAARWAVPGAFEQLDTEVRMFRRLPWSDPARALAEGALR
jgi:hypothetical protein